MPTRKTVLANGEYYHVYNRSSGNMAILQNKHCINRAINLLRFYRFKQSVKYSVFKKLPSATKLEKLREAETKPLVQVLAYAFMPDHYHLLLKQTAENGISQFISNFQNAFAKYYNKRESNRGSVFLNPFRTKWIESEELLMHISRYIHLNPVSSYLMDYEKLKKSNQTSLPLYFESKKDFVDTSTILAVAGSRKKYSRFVNDQKEYQRKLKAIKNLLKP